MPWTEYHGLDAMDLNRPKKLLLIRLDRIGDLALTMPVDSAFAQDQVHWWIPQGLSFLANHAIPKRTAFEINRHVNFVKFIKLLLVLRNHKYDAAILFHGPWWISLLLWLARIPLRGGVKSQWHSLLFLNRAIRQKRSRAEYSELEYSFQLVEKVFKFANLKREHFTLAGEQGPGRNELLARFQLQEKKYFVIHPGMGGSALNWPTEYYAELIQNLVTQNTIVITGTKSDELYLDPLRLKISKLSNVVWLDQKLNGAELLTVLGNAIAVVAPSTGVIHLAAATGTLAVGIYSPVRVQHPRRWGPKGGSVKIFLPEVECPGEFSCLGSSCFQYDCMKKITPHMLAAELKTKQNQLNGSP